MENTIGNIPKPTNEAIAEYASGSSERKSIESEISRVLNTQVDIPCIIDGREVHTGTMGTCIQPHDHNSILARYHKAGDNEIGQAIQAALKAKPQWESMPYTDRAAIFNKAAVLLSGKYRDKLNAVTMLNQSKNVYQAEIDAACELADFWRFNSYYMQKLYEEQPLYSPPGIQNSMEYRALEGFVFAVSPFNFTSIGGNLSCAPAVMGNTVVWKPASTAVYAAFVVMEILAEAGLPDGVINLIPGDGALVGDRVLESEWFAGIHFTGSTGVFRSMWDTIGSGISAYRSYPRIVGETGGKDFLVAHESADIEALAVAAIRGAFEYQGQKCSALSRMYVPVDLWPQLKDRMVAFMETISIGPPQDFSNFMNAVIDKNAFEKTAGFIERA
ncbi:MAG: aldehyde dehydrogenase family protein, partial [Spirochaetales bacterium]|nr:aldehyde dehydrogenase family protein [Spirochaetales bacterium]